MVINKIEPVGAPSALRRTHRSIALRALLGSPGLSRTALADQLGISPMAVSRIVRDLIETGLVEESGALQRDSGPGRRQTQLRIRDTGTYAAGIALSAYSSEISIVSAAGKPVAHRVIALTDLSDGERAAAALATELNALIDELDIARDRIVGVGVAIGANLDADNIHVTDANYLAWKPFNLVETVSSITGLPVKAENIVCALTLAEASVGAAKNCRDVVTVRVATSIGASILQHGQIVRGHGNRPGRVGHFRTGPTSLTCSCGGQDCLNCSASGWSVLARLGKIDNPAYDANAVVDYARMIDGLPRSQSPDADANDDLSAALHSAGRALSGALQILNQTVDPEAIILAGSMARFDAYVAGLKQDLGETAEGNAVRDKLLVSDIRAHRAAAILVLLEKVYSPALEFEALRNSSGIAIEGSDGRARQAG